jgi:hypothetical protein
MFGFGTVGGASIGPPGIVVAPDGDADPSDGEGFCDGVEHATATLAARRIPAIRIIMV